jgi:dihydroneopterin aldolase
MAADGADEAGVRLMDQILIDDLAVSCTIGIHDWERSSRQHLLISLVLDTDISAAATSDDISSTVDYVAASELVLQTARAGSFRLIETLASTLADRLLALNGVSGVQVTVRKPAAVRQAGSVGVRINRP